MRLARAGAYEAADNGVRLPRPEGPRATRRGLFPRCFLLRSPESCGAFPAGPVRAFRHPWPGAPRGRLAQWQSAALTRQRSLVQIQHRPPSPTPKRHQQHRRLSHSVLPRTLPAPTRCKTWLSTETALSPFRAGPKRQWVLELICRSKLVNQPTSVQSLGFEFPGAHVLDRKQSHIGGPGKPQAGGDVGQRRFCRRGLQN